MWSGNFDLGAAGYVHKLKMQSELLPAIETILKAKLFVGSGVEDDLREGAATQAPSGHLDRIQSLKAEGVDVAAAIEKWTFVPLGAVEKLSRLWSMIYLISFDA